jgi:hypothetical protein
VNQPTTDAPQAYARAAGLLYVIIIVTAMFGEFFVRGSLVVRGDAAATAANIMGAPQLFRLGFASDLVAFCCDVGVALALYVLLRPVNRNLALLAAFFRLVQTAILGGNLLNHLAAALLLDGSSYLAAIPPEQLHALALLSLDIHSYGYDVGLVFFGFHCIVAGYLIAISGYFPRLIGWLLMFAGAGYLVDSFTSVLARGVNAAIEPFVLGPVVLAEFALTGWLLFKGVNRAKWDARTAAAARA